MKRGLILLFITCVCIHLRAQVNTTTINKEVFNIGQVPKANGNCSVLLSPINSTQ